MCCGLKGHVLRFLDRVESDLQWLIHGGHGDRRVNQPEKRLAGLVDHREVENWYAYTSQRCR